MTERRRRDGELDPVDGGAQAVGPRSSRTPEGDQGRDDDPGGGDGTVAPAGDDATPRVRGAWTTPAVVVRGPDGEVVPPGGGAPGHGSGRGPGSGSGRGPGPGRRRVRPRRIPGAPGAVLLRPTLMADAADGRDARRRRRAAGAVASVTPLPPRPTRRGAAGPDDTDSPDRAAPVRPTLRPVGPGAGDRRGRRGPSRSRPGEPRPQRVLRALSGLNFERLLPSDDEARGRRALQLRRAGASLALVALVGLVVYSVFPVRTWINQRSAADRAREQLAAFERENDLLEEEARQLRSDEHIEVLARELGMVLPGEELYGIYPAPAEPAPSSGTTSTTERSTADGPTADGSTPEPSGG